MTLSLAVWIVGGILALAFGIWAGLGYPGLYDRYGPGPSRRERMGTWMNRWIYGGPRPRRFSTKNLIVPKPREEARGGDESVDRTEREERPSVRDE